jgi:hypothetical protein
MSDSPSSTPSEGPEVEMTDSVAKVDKWLEKQGYPLEYEVARTFQKAGFRAFQGIHYQDAEGTDRKTREIDVVATEWPEGTTRKSNVDFVVEVKHTHEPWLVLTTEAAVKPTDIARWLLTSEGAEAPIEGLLRAGPITDLLVVPPRYGFNVVQTIKDMARTNPAYVALTNVVKAANARREVWKRAVDRPSVYFPLVVVGGSLVQLGYDATGERILNPVLWQRIRWSGSSISDSPILVDIVTREHLPTWVTNARKSTQAISELFEAWVTPPKA